jgi:hypothetical protein
MPRFVYAQDRCVVSNTSAGGSLAQCESICAHDWCELADHCFIAEFWVTVQSLANLVRATTSRALIGIKYAQQKLQRIPVRTRSKPVYVGELRECI